MKKILITGSKGQLGKAVEKQLNSNGDMGAFEIINTDVEELDISNLDQVISLIGKHKPNFIVNCAAHTAVDLCETDKDNAFKINAIGARNLAIASEMHNSIIIHISTDYVFDGVGEQCDNNLLRPYTEFDIPNPQTVYGQSKLQGENFIKQMTNRYFIIRTAWLYGEGNNFVNTMLELAKTKDSLKVVNDQYGTPTSTKELAKMIVHLIKTNFQYGIYHGTCEGSCTWYEFAKEIFKISNIDIQVIPCSSEEFVRPAKRPHYSVLDNYMLKLTTDFRLKDWKDALEEFLNS